MRKFLTMLSCRHSACAPVAEHSITTAGLDAEAQAIKVLGKYSSATPDGIGDPKS